MAFTSSLFAQKTIVHGKVLNSLGNSILHSYVHLSMFHNPDKEQKVLKTDSDGTYEIVIDKFGVYELLYAAVNYKSEKLIIINDKDQSIAVDVKLGGYLYNNNFDSVKVVGDYNSFNFQSAQKMTKNKNGTYSFEIDCDSPEFRYQLIGITPKRSINGTESNRYEYDNGGDFRSVIKTKNGKASFTFDPNKLPNINPTSSIEFLDNNNILSKLNDYFLEFERYIESKSFGSNINNKNTNEINNQISIKEKDFYEKLKDEFQTTSDPERKKLATVFLLYAKRYKKGELDSVLVEKYFNSLGPTSPYWSIDYYLVDNAKIFLPNDKYKNLVRNIISKNTDDNFVSYVVSSELMRSLQSSNYEKAKEYYKILSENYSHTGLGNFALKTVSLRKELNVGDDIPDYEVTSLDNSKKIISKKNMLGKIYLIDFWGTWCGGCIAEMENLHNAFINYKNKSFMILSFAMDKNPSVVKKFRTKKWKMPWLHSFISNKPDDPFFKRFDVIWYPKPILVDKKGKIIAIENELRGDNLDETLSKYLK